MDLLSAVQAVLEAAGLQVEVEEHEVGRYLQVRPADGEASWPMIVLAEDESGRVLVYSYLPVEVPEQHRLAVAELLTRANWGLYVGNFELDLSDGEVRFKTSVELGGAGEVDPALIAGLVSSNIVAMETYVDAVLAVASGEVTPADAIAEVEA